MQKREKILFFAFIAIAGGWLILPRLYGFFYDPIRELTDQRDSLSSVVSAKEIEEIQLIQARGRVQTWQQQALPPDPVSSSRITANDGQRLYLEWLTELAQLSGWERAVVSPGGTTTRRDAYIQVDVNLTARVKFDALCRFLYHFEKAALLHRIGAITVEADSSVGDPWLDVAIRAEGLALHSGTPRQILFPRTTTRDAVDAQQTTITLEGSSGFPTRPPFRVRMGSEYLTVTAIAGNNWTVERGSDATTPSPHDSGAIVELAPVAASEQDQTFEQFQGLIADSFFLKGRIRPEYNPRLELDGSPVAVRGSEWSRVIRAENRDPSLSPLMYEFASEPPPGLTLDAETGQLTWKIADDLEPGEYPVEVLASTQDASESELKTVLPLELREPNEPPLVAVPERVSVYLGQQFSMVVEAFDPDGDEDDVRFSLEADPELGMEIDARSGRIEWVVPESISPNVYDVAVVVTDTGTPPESTRETIRFDVRDDMARFTFLIAAGTRGDDPEAWLFNRLENRRTTLREGDRFRVSEFDGEVVTIDRDRMVVLLDDGFYQLRLGENVRAMRPIEPTEELLPPNGTERATTSNDSPPS